MADLQPDKPSSAYIVMSPDWRLVRDVRGGARTVRAAGETYLPRFPSEEREDYNRRVATAPFSAHYEDATRTLVAKPFAKEVSLQGDVPTKIRDWAENVDLAGHNLHVFSRKLFEEALHMGGAFLFVDYPEAVATRTLAEERATGARPYFRLIPIDEMLGIYETQRNGRTIISQIRFRDNAMVLDGFEEKLVERVRVFDDVDGTITQRVFTKADEKWEAVETTLTGPTEIFVVALMFGLEVSGRYGVKPTMLDLAQRQMDHYRHANRLDDVFDFAGFPMLQAEGMGPPMQTIVEPDGSQRQEQAPIRVGPRSVLFAAPAQEGERPRWSFLQPQAGIIKEIREHLKDIEGEMRTLGLQPLLPSVGMQNMAATTSAINSARTHSSVQSWALMLKDALEQGFVYMARWAKLAETTEVFVFTDFAAEVLQDADEKELREMFVLGVITWDTYVDEMQRRGILGPQFDKDKERARLETSGDGLGMGSDEADTSRAAT